MKRNDLRIHLNNLEKEQQTELKESARIIMKIRTKGKKTDQKKKKKKKTTVEKKSFSVKGQMVNILNFVGHMLQLLISAIVMLKQA